jgi:hypothetical protein
MRRAIAHSLLVTFSLLLIAPLFAPDAEANLPACCRRAGKHHCMMRSVETSGSKEAGFTSVHEKCPCLPESTGAVHSVKYIPEAGQRFYTEVLFHPGYAPHTAARSRIAFLRSHQKRGPPSHLA